MTEKKTDFRGILFDFLVVRVIILIFLPIIGINFRGLAGLTGNKIANMIVPKYKYQNDKQEQPLHRKRVVDTKIAIVDEMANLGMSLQKCLLAAIFFLPCNSKKMITMSDLFTRKCYRLLGLLTVLCFYAHTVQAAKPDTIHVRVHDKVDMVWFESYDREGLFPIADREFHRVWMEVTIGCASGGCSDWDYTVLIHLLADEEYELGRLITPYGGYMANNANGFNNDWTHRYRYDITDFVHLFEENTTIRAFYSGWSAGFSVTTDFYFIEGSPPREVLGIENIVHGSHNYTDAVTYNEVHTPAVELLTPLGTVQSKLRYLPSGHGFDNNVFCAEFCPRNYFLYVDGSRVGSGTIWKDDCGRNALYPQGGTWVYDRANWCPGEAVPLHEFELGDLLQAGQMHEFDLDLEAYTWSGDQAPSYTTSFQVVYYGDWNIHKDAELLEIIAPSRHEDHFRLNPICSNPIVLVQNSGRDPIQDITFEYGFPGGEVCTYLWTGSLQFGERATIELPAPIWNSMDVNRPEFFVRILEVDGAPDEVLYNNELKSEIGIPTELPSLFAVNFRTHTRFSDFTYGVYKEDGSPVFERVPSSPNSMFSDTVNLAPGCYSFRVADQAGFGLANWPTGQGTGSIDFRRPIGPIWTTLRTLRRDFGSEYTINFTVGYELFDEPDRGGCGFPVSTVDEMQIETGILVSPNPTTGIVNIICGNESRILEVSVYSADGKLVRQNRNTEYGSINLDLSGQRDGLYFIRIKTDSRVVVERVLLQQ
ncbi:MAG: T9SS C-terminal target domain-containing protein [Saprospirales bacterium]|nr:MAG: T9SS C-terminal target domain-containing protein [Saprospirales bacterium]